jgi:4-cresol dehydrogenase (hydroxylating) flavoprotein subunit
MGVIQRDRAAAAAAALEDWRAALGAEKVAADDATIARYARTTQAQAPRPACVLYPTTTEEVQAVVRIAGKHGAVVYPISRGKNWGYGDACAPVEGAAIIDLSRMNRILEVNTELAYCVIESGVSQGELFDYLRDNETGLWMDATAAGPDSSLVGNTVDRGFGHTRYGDHFLTCCGMEIVLADGRLLNTGFGHYANARAHRVYPYGIGPYMDGIFCQSNYGIITKIGLWLMPEPEAFNFFYVGVENFEDMGPLVDRLRPLRLNGTLNTAIHIGNDFRVLAGTGRYPWDETGGKAPLPPEVRERIRRERGAFAWQGSGSITGTKAHVRASRKALKNALKGFATLRFLTDGQLTTWERLMGALNKVGLFTRMGGRAKIVRPNFELLRGNPVDEPLRGAQWRLRNPPDEPCDPLDAGGGLYWLSPVMPMQGAQVMELLRLVEPIFVQHGFDMVVSFILLTERSLVAIFNIAFDQSQPGEARQASDCYEAILKAMMDNGYIIYRSGLQGMPKLAQEGDVFWEVARQLKETLDPQDIIAPGRYIAPLG